MNCQDGIWIVLFFLIIFRLAIKQKVILEEYYIQIRAFYILCCLNKNSLYNYINIKSCKVDIETKRDSDGDEIKTFYILCLDIFN